MAASAGESRSAALEAEQRAWTFGEVYETYFAFVWRSARRLGAADSALEDIAQDVFLVVHRRLASFQGKSSIQSWLFGIVVRVVRDARRSLRRKPGNLGGKGRAMENFDSVADRAAPSPHESAAKAEAVRTLHAFLDAMPESRRYVFILAELEQMSVGDIAAAVGANVNTVHSRLRAARADFERALARARAGDQWRRR